MSNSRQFHLMDALMDDRHNRSAFGLSRDAWGRLLLIDANGVRHPNVTPVPMFPLSDAARWISLCDASRRELAFVNDPAELPADTRRLLEEELTLREFVPVIDRIVSVSGNTEPCEWEVRTDRGPTRFVLKREDDVRRVGGQQVLVIDAHGIRYRIADLRKLDSRSRRFIEWYV